VRCSSRRRSTERLNASNKDSTSDLKQQRLPGSQAIIQELMNFQTAHPSNLKVLRVNANAMKCIADRYGIQTFPTYKFFFNNSIRATFNVNESVKIRNRVATGILLSQDRKDEETIRKVANASSRTNAQSIK